MPTKVLSTKQNFKCSMFWGSSAYGADVFHLTLLGLLAIVYPWASGCRWTLGRRRPWRCNQSGTKSFSDETAPGNNLSSSNLDWVGSGGAAGPFYGDPLVFVIDHFVTISELGLQTSSYETGACRLGSCGRLWNFWNVDGCPVSQASEVFNAEWGGGAHVAGQLEL
jgi:hypothetical protein